MRSAKFEGETCYVGVGSNVDPEVNITKALEILFNKVDLWRVSTFYYTAAVGQLGQPEFLNGVIHFDTDLPARALKYELLRGIESELGRMRSEDKYAPRPIDFDIILFGDSVIDEPGLRIPDPEIRTRPFLAFPLLELAPGIVLPDTGEAVATIARSLDRASLRPAKDFTDELRARLYP